MEQKHYLKSKTIWFNMFIAAFTVLTNNVELLQEYMSNGGYLLVMMFISAVGTYLRTITTDSVTIKK